MPKAEVLKPTASAGLPNFKFQLPSQVVNKEDEKGRKVQQKPPVKKEETEEPKVQQEKSTTSSAADSFSVAKTPYLILTSKDTIYSTMDELSKEDLDIYRSQNQDRLVFGKVPTRPPPAALCH